MSAHVRAAVLTHYFEVAASLKLDTRPLLRRVGLSKDMLADPEQRIPAIAALQLLEASAEAAHCPTFGLRMAELRQLADLGSISLLLAHQRTLRDVLNTSIHYRQLLNESLAMQIEEAGKFVIVREELVVEGCSALRQANELALGVFSRLCRALLGPHWQPESVHFTHEAPADLQVHRRLFKCRLAFTSEFNGVVCAAADLNLPNPAADPAMATYARRFIESLPGAHERSVVLEARKAIYLLLPMGRANIEHTARGLRLTVRTLQRQLDEAGEVFSDLVTGVRRDLAQVYLAVPKYSLGQIAALLGYSVQSSFTRWFTAEFGMTPASWRSRHKQAKKT